MRVHVEFRSPQRCVSLCSLNFGIMKENSMLATKGWTPMPKYVHYSIMVLCIVLIFFLYNKALGSIPFLILSFYLFFFGWMQLKDRKKKTR